MESWAMCREALQPQAGRKASVAALAGRETRWRRLYSVIPTRNEMCIRDSGRIVDAYLADERCTFRFTVNGYYNLFTSIEEAGKQENLERCV